ncbi:hypothetical protein ACQ4PT_054056 [Festuca glaucescens]
MANRASVPKFGTWDTDNVGYTVYFEKVRENKGATAPPLQRPFNPNDPEEDAPPRLITPAASNRPASSSGGHRAGPQQQQHRRAGSSSSVASDPGGHRGGHQSKFAPPPQYHPRPQASPHHQPPNGHHGGDHGQHQRPAGHQKPHDARHQQQQAAPRARSASPSPHHVAQGGRQRPVAVPKFGVWDEQSAAAQGFTVQFERVKRDREVARGAPPGVPRRRMPSPESYANARRSQSRHTPFYSKMFGCFLPHTRD